MVHIQSDSSVRVIVVFGLKQEKHDVIDKRGVVGKHHNTHTILTHSTTVACFSLNQMYEFLAISHRMSSNLLMEKFRANVLFWNTEIFQSAREKKAECFMGKGYGAEQIK